MPALLPVPGVVQLTVNQTFAGVPVVNVHYVQSIDESGWTEAQLALLASTYTGWLTGATSFRQLQSSALAYTRLDLVDLTSDTSPQLSANLASVGSSAGATEAAQVAMCIGWTIARRYRGGHPRTYLGGMVTSSRGVPNQFNAPAIATAAAAGIALRAALNGGGDHPSGQQMVAVHRTRDLLILNPPETSQIITATVDTRIDTQRRRLGPDV